MKGYKAFSKGMICRGKQYAENTVFEEDKAVICEKGMHFCERPLDVLDYYPLIDDNGEFTEFAEVEALDDPVTDDNKKYCTKKLKIGAKITFKNLVDAFIGYVKEETKINSAQQVGGNYALQVGGNYAQQVGGKNSILVNGTNSVFKAGLHSVIVCYEYDTFGNLKSPNVVQVDGEKIKADTWYKLENGEFVEVDNAEA